VVDRVASEVFGALRPRERHLLLSVCGEESVSPSTAAHLTHDNRAGEILAELETTGLLVTTQPEQESGTDPDETQAYRIHPLLVEVARRRLNSGGVDVAQAKSTVRRAVRLDIASGEARMAFDRLVAIEEPGEAAALLTAQGLSLVLRGAGGRLHSFSRRYRAAVEEQPGCWPAIAAERWFAVDTSVAARWFDRILGHEGNAVERSCVRLMRSGLGEEPVAPAVAAARAAESQERSQVTNHPALPLLQLQVGVAELWLGDLPEAELHLSAALMASRAHSLPLLTGEALTHLAVAQYLMGRERACLALADEAKELAWQHAWLPSSTVGRGTIVAEMARRRRLPWQDPSSSPDLELPKVHDGDPTTKYLARCLRADRLLAGGLVGEAENAANVPLEVLDLPAHLRVRGLVDRAAHAALASDRETLEDIGERLLAMDAPGEAAFASGLRADLVGDQRRAAELFGEAASRATYAQPPTAATALVCRAQLLDSTHHTDEAVVALQAALTATEVRGNAAPFAGWIRHGTPVSTLLTRLQKRSPSKWGAELVSATSAHPGLTAFFGAVTPTPQERALVPEQVMAPAISPREREVLYELARGSTYAAVAANLFVSENTVKTHVSSLYAKLAVRRRSEALAIARTLHLI
jgi:DNA-binding CsgD family transcriptional regulator